MMLFSSLLVSSTLIFSGLRSRNQGALVKSGRTTQFLYARKYQATHLRSASLKIRVHLKNIDQVFPGVDSTSFCFTSHTTGYSL